MSSRAPHCIHCFLLGLSALIMAAALVAGMALVFSSGGGGFLTGLGKALGLLLIAAGNMLSWVLNLLCWYRTRIRWLGVVVGLQSLPAVLFAGWLATMGVEELMESRASDQRSNVYQAIQADDVPALQQALPKCGERCQEFFSLQRSLMLASLHRSHQSARYLLEYGANYLKHDASAYGYDEAQTSLYTCEGTYLSSLGALDLAVANHDMDMLALLWPAGNDQTRSQALWTAARLDRLDMVHFMTGLHSVPDTVSSDIHAFQPNADTLQPLIRKTYRNQHETLLRAAATGAAIDVGRWLLETRPIDLPDDEVQNAMTDLLMFSLDTHTPRSAGFAHLLLEHGADIQAATLQDEPALERAIRYGSKPVASLLLKLGTDRTLLSEEDALQLDALLDEPDRLRSYRDNTPGCVAP